MNKHGVSRRWFTEADIRHFKNGALKLDSHLPKKIVFSASMKALKK